MHRKFDKTSYKCRYCFTFTAIGIAFCARIMLGEEWEDAQSTSQNTEHRNTGTHLLTSLCAATFCLRSSSLSTFSLEISSCSLLSWPATTLPSRVTIVTEPDTIS